MRERTTWNREQIVKLANGLKKAEDPRAMNQDHLSQQPAADKYETGGPSEFGEDVAAPNWKAEYSGGEVKRNEIGLPEMRSETFSHPEKTAAQQDGDEDEDDGFLEKKADVCLDIARKMLPKSASKQTIEDQAFAFMHMADADIVATAARLAAQQDEEKKEDDQAKQADQIPENFKKKDDEDKGQQEAKQADQIPENFKKKDDEDKGQQQAKEGGQIPENFKKKDDEDKGQQQAKEAQGQQDQGEGKEDEQQKKEAAINDLRKRACDALMQNNQQLAQDLVQQMSQMQQAPQQQQQMSQQQAQDQIDQMLAQAQQGQPQQVMATDDQLLDRMLAEPKAASTETSMLTASTGNMMDIQLEGPSMDMTEVRLGAEDEALTALFASHDEVQQANQAHALQTGIPVQASGGMTRTASTRTVGTRPSGGVAQLGGASAPSSSGGEIDKLAGLWASAPDVKSVFDT